MSSRCWRWQSSVSWSIDAFGWMGQLLWKLNELLVVYRSLVRRWSVCTQQALIRFFASFFPSLTTLPDLLCSEQGQSTAAIIHWLSWQLPHNAFTTVVSIHKRRPTLAQTLSQPNRHQHNRQFHSTKILLAITTRAYFPKSKFPELIFFNMNCPQATICHVFLIHFKAGILYSPAASGNNHFGAQFIEFLPQFLRFQMTVDLGQFGR